MGTHTVWKLLTGAVMAFLLLLQGTQSVTIQVSDSPGMPKGILGNLQAARRDALKLPRPVQPISGCRPHGCGS